VTTGTQRPRRTPRKPISAALAAFAFLAAAGSARGQIVRPEDLPGWSLVPSVQTIGLYEDNVILNVNTPTSGTFLRVTPSLETHYRGPLGFFSASYSIDRERHSESLKGLDDLARQVGTLSFQSRANERTSLSGTANYITTERPEEVFDAANLISTVRRTTRLLGNVGVEHTLTPKWRANVDYTLTVDDFGDATEVRPGARTIFDQLHAALTVQKTERNAFSLQYDARNVVGEERTFRSVTRGVFWSSSLTGRWARKLSPHFTATVAAGPRLSQVVPAVISPSATTPTEWKLDTEALASIAYRRNDQRVSMSYTRTQSLGYGASGFINTESLEARGAWLVAQRLRLTVRPGVYRNSLAGLIADSYRFDSFASYYLASWASLDAVVSYKYQDRALALADFAVTSVLRSRTRNRVAFGVTFRRAIRLE